MRGTADLGRRFPVVRYTLIACAGLAVVALATTITHDISYWHDGISISEHALAVTGPNCLMERALGEAFYSQGRINEALEHLTRSLQIRPTETAFFEIGTIKLLQRKVDEAEFYFQQALRYPEDASTAAKVHNSLLVLGMQKGSLAAAEKDFRESVALDPSSARHRVAFG